MVDGGGLNPARVDRSIDPARALTIGAVLVLLIEIKVPAPWFGFGLWVMVELSEHSHTAQSMPAEALMA